MSIVNIPEIYLFLSRFYFENFKACRKRDRILQRTAIFHHLDSRVHLSLHPILLAHFQVSCRHQYLSPLNTSPYMSLTKVFVYSWVFFA